MEYFRIDAYVVDTLLRDLVGHDRQPSAFLVYLFLSRCAQREGVAAPRLALMDIAEGTGLSKRSVQNAVSWLAKRQLVRVGRESITAIASYELRQPWRR